MHSSSKDPQSKNAVIYAGVTTAIVVIIWLILTQTTLRDEDQQPDFTWRDSFQALGNDISQAIDENPLPSTEERPRLLDTSNLLESNSEQEYGTETTSEQ